MQFAIIVCLLVAGAFAAPGGFGPHIPVVERTEVHDDFGQFSLRYISADGTVFTETGALKPSHDGRGHVLVKQGEYSFTAPNGQVYRTKYVADENGFRAEGDHLPQSVVV